jgi:hypothetical protein
MENLLIIILLNHGIKKRETNEGISLGAGRKEVTLKYILKNIQKTDKILDVGFGSEYMEKYFPTLVRLFVGKTGDISQAIYRLKK